MAVFTPPPIQFKRSITVGNKPADSDLLVGEIAINLRDRVIYTKNDSDVIVQLGINSDYDSDILKLYHDYQAADSDIQVALELIRLQNDSDNIVRINDYDSDVNVIYHSFTNADSDLRADMDSDFTVVYHDYQAADSDIINTLVRNIDSDVNKIYHDYQAADSDLRADMDSDFTVVYHDYQAADSDLRVDMDSDFTVVYHDYKAADSDIVNTLVRDIDSDIDQIYHDYRAADSDLRVDMDSDFTVVYHDYQAADSDLRIDMDSDFTVVYHDYQAADSDLRAEIDSDRANLKVGNLVDVDFVTLPPRHGQVLTYDSDSDKWIPTFIQTTAEQKRETFIVATAGTTEFVLLTAPSGEVQIARNAMILVDTAAYVDSEVIVHYVPANNNNQTMRVGDQVDITYVVSTTTTIPSFIVDGGTA